MEGEAVAATLVSNPLADDLLREEIDADDRCNRNVIFLVKYPKIEKVHDGVLSQMVFWSLLAIALMNELRTAELALL